MDTQSINKLALACNQFYLNKYIDLPTISDSEFDKLRSDYEFEGGSISSLIEWDEPEKLVHDSTPGVPKKWKRNTYGKCT